MLVVLCPPVCDSVNVPRTTALRAKMAANPKNFMLKVFEELDLGKKWIVFLLLES